MWEVVTVGHKGRLRRWNVASGECVAEQALPEAATPSELRQLLYSEARGAFYALTFDQQIQRYDATDLHLTRQVSNTGLPVTSITTSS